MVSNLEINYKEIAYNPEICKLTGIKDSQDYLEVLFINADKIRESIDAATNKVIRDATEEDVKLKEVSIRDGRMLIILEINRKPNRLLINYVSRITLLYEGPEDADTLGRSLWTD